MQEIEIVNAIEQARKGINQYLAIMEMFPVVDVSTNKAFQRLFNGFYRIRQRTERWYSEYYSYMESCKNNPVPFEAVLDRIYTTLGRYEPSFSSKLAATLDPREPVWDKYILRNIGQNAPSYTAFNKFEEAKTVFGNIRQWYAENIQSTEGKMMIEVFNDMVEAHSRITSVKKIDFILWKTRS